MRASLRLPCVLGLALSFGTLSLSATERTDVGNSKHPQPKLTPYQKLERRIDSAIKWDVDPAKPIARIEVNLSENMLYAYQADDNKQERLVAMTLVSHGRAGHETPPGRYEVMEKDPEHKSSEYGSWVRGDGSVVSNQAKVGDSVPSGTHYEAAPMPWFLRLTGDGVGLHAGFVTGTPLSHGCIRLPLTFAQELYPLVSVGTTVVVSP